MKSIYGSIVDVNRYFLLYGIVGYLLSLFLLCQHPPLKGVLKYMAEGIISRRGFNGSGRIKTILKEEFITRNTIWTVPNVINNSVEVRLFGGGGSGSNTSGGGGGNMNYDIIDVMVPGAQISITIGAGGRESNSLYGISGGTTSFGSYLSASGGEGGVAGHGGNGGTGGGGAPYMGSRGDGGKGYYGGGGGGCGGSMSHTNAGIGGGGGIYGGGGGGGGLWGEENGGAGGYGGTYGGKGGNGCGNNNRISNKADDGENGINTINWNNVIIIDNKALTGYGIGGSGGTLLNNGRRTGGSGGGGGGGFGGNGGRGGTASYTNWSDVCGGGGGGGGYGSNGGSGGGGRGRGGGGGGGFGDDGKAARSISPYNVSGNRFIGGGGGGYRGGYGAGGNGGGGYNYNKYTDEGYSEPGNAGCCILWYYIKQES